MATSEQVETAAERRVRHLAVIRDHITTHQRPPTPAELVEAEVAAGNPRLHRRMVQVDLRVMARNGVIELDEGVVRGIRLPGVRVELVPVDEPAPAAP